MKSTGKNLGLKILIWLAVEVWLNLLGLDDLADYSEFIFHSGRVQPIKTQH